MNGEVCAMTLFRRVLFALTLVFLSSAKPALAQSDDDWDLATDSSQQLTIASVEYADGISVITQCRAGDLQTAILSLPPAAPGTGWYDLRLATGQEARTNWTRQADGTTLLANANARLVRYMKGGGRLTISSDARTNPPFRLQLDLPPGSNGLDAVLHACGYPATDERDLLLSVDELLTGFPRPIVPDRVIERRAAPTFQVSISCIVSGGRYSACRSEHQLPSHPEDGQIVANEVNGVRVQATDMAAAEGRVLDLVVTGSRIRRPRSGPGL